jgi:hypothetical protein
VRVFSFAKLLAAISAISFAVAGCAGYRVGTLLPPRYKTIAVPMFRNESDQPHIEAMATNAAIEKFNVDGTLRVLEHDADLLLECTIVVFDRTPVRYAEGIRPIEYRLTVTVSATLRDLHEGEKLWSKRLISGDALFLVAGDLYSSEMAAVPKAMEDLAHDIVEAVVEDW